MNATICPKWAAKINAGEFSEADKAAARDWKSCMVGEALDFDRLPTMYTNSKREHNRIDIALRRTHPELAQAGAVLYSAVHCRIEFPTWAMADEVLKDCLAKVTRYVIEHGAEKILNDVQNWRVTYRGRRVPAKPPVSAGTYPY